MFRYLIPLILIMSALAGGQTGAFYTDRALGVNPISPGTNGVPSPVFISYGWVRVCTLPTSGSPCNTPATITDIFGNSLSIIGGNFGQLQTDVVGRFSFGCTPGNYQVQVAATSSNTPQLNYPVTCPANSSIITSNNTWTGTQTFNGAVTFNSPVTINSTLTLPLLSINSLVCTNASSTLSTTCAGIVTNANLANSSVTFNGQAVALGATGNVNAGAAAHSLALNEGNGNLMTGLALGAHQVPVGVAGADPAAKTVPDCQDSSGNHLNYTQSTDAWSCGTTSSTVIGYTAIRVFSVTGCTPASSTDSQCTGTITVSPAFADANYIPQLTANGNGGTVPNLVVTVNGALAAGSIPYAISCTFDCGTVPAPTIYVTAIHP